VSCRRPALAAVEDEVRRFRRLPLEAAPLLFLELADAQALQLLPHRLANEVGARPLATLEDTVNFAEHGFIDVYLYGLHSPYFERSRERRASTPSSDLPTRRGTPPACCAGHPFRASCRHRDVRA